MSSKETELMERGLEEEPLDDSIEAEHEHDEHYLFLQEEKLAKEKAFAKMTLDASNTTLLCNFWGYLLRIYVTMCYFFAMLVVLGFSVNLILSLHFAFFLPVLKSGDTSQKAFTFITLLACIPSFGYILSIWLTRVFDLMEGSWLVNFRNVYFIFSNIMSQKETVSKKAKTVVDFLAFLMLPIVSVIFLIVGIAQADGAMTVVEYTFFSGVFGGVIVSWIVFLANIIAAMRSARFPAVASDPDPPRTAGMAYLLHLFGKYWTPQRREPEEIKRNGRTKTHKAKLVLCCISGIVALIFIVVLMQNSDLADKSWLYTLLGVSLIFTLFFGYASVAEARMNTRVLEEIDDDDELDSFRETTIKVAIVGFFVCLVLIAFYQLISPLFFAVMVAGVFICFVIIVFAVIFHSRFETLFNVFHPTSSSTARGGDTALAPHTPYSRPVIWKRWFLNIVRVIPRAGQPHPQASDVLRVFFLVFGFVFYVIAIGAAYHYLGESTSFLFWGLIVCLIVGPLLFDMQGNTRQFIITVFISILVSMGVFTIVFGSMIQNTARSDPAFILNVPYNTDNSSSYPLCNARWDGFDVVDMALLAKAAYYHTDENIVFDQMELVFPGIFNVRRLGGDPAQVYELEHKTENVTIITIRGTAKMADWVEDVDVFFESIFVAPFAPVMPTNVTSKLVYYFSVMQDAVYSKGRMYYEDVVDNVAALMLARPHHRFYATGHSLGGAISKILGARLKIPAFAFSGPGLLYTRETLDVSWHDINTYSINIVPRSDPVPKVGMLGGLSQDIDCDLGFMCHSILNTVCELLNRCGDWRGMGRGIVSTRCVQEGQYDQNFSYSEPTYPILED
eukprot:GCRY01001014.1.p1 GENE.GCRY01001014.1~~GCRY01001014.1.p1  ORF type:complete len:844 (+),score=185.51 GCRY01001014.1:222-2753(+)